MSSKIPMPKAGLFGPDGKPSAAGRAWFAKVGDRVTSQSATDAAGLLKGDSALIEAQALWDALVTDKSSGAGNWSPDLSQKLDFWRTVTGATIIGYPLNPLANTALFYSVRIIQDGTGGRPVSFGAGLEGTAPVILTGAHDQTLLGFQVTGPASFVAWSYKTIQFSA